MPIYTEMLKIRVASSVAAQTRKKAFTEGVTVSELVRSALRRELKEAA